jgi:polysaccharide export outer membrane protein
MKRSLGTRPALICVSVCLIGHICAGQVGPPPAPPPAAQPAAPQTITPAPKPATPDENAPEVKSSVTPIAAETPAPDAGPKEDSAVALTGKPYIIGALDLLDLKIWKAGNLNGIYPVDSDGTISIPLLGQVRADGLTKQQLAVSIRDKLALKVFVEAPDVNEITVEILRINSKKYSVFGAVNHQGDFPLLGSMTVMDALANCGGFQPFAKTNKIFITRGDKKFTFNFKEVSHNKKLQQNIEIQSGDRIFVPD